MSQAHRRFAQALKGARALVVKPVGPEAWFLNYPFRPWRRKSADRERLELLRLLLAEAPVCGFCLDDDLYEKLSAVIGVERQLSTEWAPWLFAPADEALRSLGQLYEGNWCLILFDEAPSEPPRVPHDLGMDSGKIRRWLKESRGSAAVLSLPDDLEWLVVLSGPEDQATPV